MVEEKSGVTFSKHRRQFFTDRLRAHISNKDQSNIFSLLPFLPPPRAVSEIFFDQTCTNCGDCIHVCPTQILSSGSLGEGIFCGKCEASVLIKIDNQKAWNYTIAISKKCLLVQRVTCRSCGDGCESEAIRFQLETDGKAIPHVNTRKLRDVVPVFPRIPSMPFKSTGKPPNDNL